jgi:hypothetical protein
MSSGFCLCISSLILADLLQRAAILSAGPYLVKLAPQAVNKDLIAFSDVRICFNELQRGWFIIHFLNDKGKKERWMFQAEHDIGLVQNLKKMHIRLRNIP